jgi:hypothetical protein
LSLQEDKDSRRRRKPEPNAESNGTTSVRTSKKKAPGEVGTQLRSAYQRMIDEDIPPAMLDLLGKLG